MAYSTGVSYSAPAASRAFSVIGAHGGAGTTTVTHWLDPQGETGTMELIPGSHLQPGYTPVVVARSTAYGVHAAVQLLGRWHPDVPRPFLVVVRDAPLPLPRPVSYRLTAIKSRVLGIAEVPYLVQLRDAHKPSEAMQHRAVQKAAGHLRAALGLPH